MRLRTRLFLWVGIIFFAAFASSLYFENYTTDKNLKEEKDKLREQIRKHTEEHRENMENSLHVSLSVDQAKIDALLLRIGRDPHFGASLFVDPSNVDTMVPAHTTYLYRSDRWLDFIQTTKDGRLTSLLIPVDFPMMTAHQIPIEEGFFWIVLDQDKEFERPYIGVRMESNPKLQESLAHSVDKMMEVHWGLTGVFDPFEMQHFERKEPLDSDLLTPINLPPFLDTLSKVADYVRGRSKAQILEEIRTKGEAGLIFKGVPFDRGIHCLNQEGKVLNNRIIQLLQRGDQALMLAAMASLFPTGDFGDGPLSKQAPKGVGRFPTEEKTGYLIFSDEVFYDKQLFDDRSYVHAHPALKNCEGIGSSMAVIAPPGMNRVFVGNTLEIKGKTGSGLLTVGIDADELVQSLVLSTRNDSFLVHDDKVISAYSKGGELIANPEKEIPLNEEMLRNKSGLVTWHEQSYYYLNMTPFTNLDLHFFSLIPEKEAFALVNALDQGSREVINQVSKSMRYIAVFALAFVLVLLHRVARKITKPITSLARVTENVAAGKLEGIELPKGAAGRHDEISTLCASFEKMVVGLKEKEKVKGILNKVVSAEIAQEITKGAIHLGGEVRKVTVLFADIRNFTRMTASKSPGEVIELLNSCMTKISHVIDEYGGVIDKYVGDEVMALFGAPIEKEDTALKAVQSALKMIDVLNEWNRERSSQGLAPVEMGIGIHTGDMLVGNMGAENRLNYTVLGSNVNFASRLCSNAKPMEILISKETLQEAHVKENIEVEEHTPIALKGYAESFTLYTVKGVKRAT